RQGQDQDADVTQERIPSQGFEPGRVRQEAAFVDHEPVGCEASEQVPAGAFQIGRDELGRHAAAPELLGDGAGAGQIRVHQAEAQGRERSLVEGEREARCGRFAAAGGRVEGAEVVCWASASGRRGRRGGAAGVGGGGGGGRGGRGVGGGGAGGGGGGGRGGRGGGSGGWGVR